MARVWKAALVAASLACASSANAAFATFTFNLTGTGFRDTPDAFGNPSFQALRGATITIGAFTYVDDTIAIGSDEYTSFEVNKAGEGYTFSFTPLPIQTSYLANGGGGTCPTCLSGYDISAPRGPFSETFSGQVTSFTVTRADTGTNFFSIVGYVPEPSPWALMLAGFGLVGYALRRRPQLAYAA